ncbi:MAG: LamG domain-containing protein [Acidobacteriota bacterium]
MRRTSRYAFPRLAGFGLAAALALFSVPSLAQPFGAWMTSSSATTDRYIEIPSSPDLNPTDQLTIEAWVVVNGGNCPTIIGKGYLTSYWVGVCNGTLRSYLSGSLTLHDGGAVPVGQWTHVAVTFDGTTTRHYINGELIASFPQVAPLAVNSTPVRIGNDANWNPAANGAIDEVRLWNVVRSAEEIRSTINVPISTGRDGLVAVWSLDAGGADAVGSHDGTNVGGVTFLNGAVAASCTPSANFLCLNTRFSVGVSWRDFAGHTGIGTVVPGASADSGIFWFFAPNAWEVLAKTVDGCGLNNRHWAFGAATTNVFYRLEFTDVRSGQTKIYFNYPGVASPAITDAGAFATCP